MALHNAVRLLSAFGVLSLVLAFPQNQVQAQWLGSSGFTGAAAYGLAADSSGAIYVAVQKQGVYKSVNAGQSWTNVHGNFDVGSTGDIAVTANDVIILGMQNDGIFTSSDGAQTWRESNAGIDSGTFTSIAELEVSPWGSVFASGFSLGVYRSTNDGASWVKVGEEVIPEDIRGVAAGLDSTVYIGGPEGVYQSVDDGDTWTHISPDINMSVSSIDISPSGTVLAGTSSPGGVFRRAAGDTSWTSSRDTDDFGSSVQAVLAASDSLTWAGTNGAGLYVSSDDGRTWDKASEGMLNRYADVLIEVEGGDLYAGTFGGGVYIKRKNESIWQKSNEGIQSTWVHDIAFDGDDVVYATTRNGLQKSTDGGETWNEINEEKFDATRTLSVQVDSAGAVYMGTLETGLFKSLDGGLTWSKTDNSLPDVAIFDLEMNDEGVLFAGVASRGVYRTSNGGNSWEHINNGIGNRSILKLAASPLGSLFAGGSLGNFFRSLDQGQTWESITEGLPNLGTMRALNVASDGTVYAGYRGSGVYRSTNNGESWQRVNSGIENDHIWALEDTPSGAILAGAYDDPLFLSGPGALYRSVDRGENWTDITGDLPNSDIVSLAVHSTGNVFVGTAEGPGVFRAVFPAVPQPVHPAQEEVGVSRAPVLNWELVASTSSYRIQLASDSLFEALIIDKAVPGGELALDPLEYAARYFWRIKALGPAGESEWSEVQAFTTGTGVGNEESASALTAFALFPAYPNPFSTSVSVDYEIPEATFATIQIYDIYGRLVETLRAEHVQPGKYRQHWQGSSHASGTYFIVLKASTFTAHRSVVLVK